jgi:hypothetical protein
MRIAIVAEIILASTAACSAASPMEMQASSPPVQASEQALARATPPPKLVDEEHVRRLEDASRQMASDLIPSSRAMADLIEQYKAGPGLAERQEAFKRYMVLLGGVSSSQRARALEDLRVAQVEVQNRL